MAPRTRSNRTETPAKEKILAIGGVVNTQGFPALPAEMYLEIISYFPVMPVPTHEKKAISDHDTDALRARHSTLLSLSQTCRSLRRVLRGYLWQRIEVFDGMQTSKGRLPSTQERIGASYHSVRLKPYAEELIRQLEIVTVRDRSLAEYVNIVNVVITNYSAETVFKEVAKAFSHFPSLHTVQLNVTIVDWGMAQNAFDDRRYPQIRTLSLTSGALFFPKFCPEVRTIVPYLGRPFARYPNDCSSLEVLGTSNLFGVVHDPVPTDMRNLRDISLVATPWISSEYFELFALSPNLHTIRFRMDQEKNLQYPGFARSEQEKTEQCKIDERVGYARKMFSEQKGSDESVKKRIIVTYEDGRVVTFDVSN